MPEEVTNAVDMDLDVERYADTAVELGMSYGPKRLLAIFTLLIGLWVIRLVTGARPGEWSTHRSTRPYGPSSRRS